MNIKINAEKLSKKENTIYYGFGMVSGNNSSRLLLDYKRECPEKYWEILHLIFDKDKIGINHLKIEMGSDVNSTSGTEPATKRTEKEEQQERIPEKGQETYMGRGTDRFLRRSVRKSG